jgi:hypothetical protein
LENAGGLARNRTGVDGFAIRCVTTPPRGLTLTNIVKMLACSADKTRFSLKQGQNDQNASKNGFLTLGKIIMHFFQ